MILIAGGTGRLGTQIVKLLTLRGLKVRILTRNPERAKQILGNELVEIVVGDVRDFDSVKRAVAGTETVISAISGFGPMGRGCNPKTVDLNGNSNLIRAAKTSDVKHFILISIMNASPDHPLELFRMKYLAEQELKSSGLDWTIIRPSISLETWASLIGEPLLKTGKTRIFGRGENPINFVSGYDVARFVEYSVVNPGMRRTQVDVGGPENLTLMQIAETFEALARKAGTKSHVPLRMMHLLSLVARPFNPTLARMIQAAIYMDNRDMTFDSSQMKTQYPTINSTSLTDVVRQEYKPIELPQA
jgi:uncharacterized protein YbjT (DUF2867 family)